MRSFTPEFDRLREQDDVSALYLHDKAVDTIGAMFMQCERIKVQYGVGKEYETAVTTLQWCLRGLFTQGFSRDSYVTQEIHTGHNLSLYVQAGPTYVFGINWRPTDTLGIAGEWSTNS